MEMFASTEAEKEVAHPVVRTHPETGRKCLYVNPGFTVRFQDMTVDESRRCWNTSGRTARTGIHLPLPVGARLGGILGQSCVQHYALNDYHGQRRVMHRVTVNGDRPV